MIFLVVAPGTVAVYVPWTICYRRFAPPLLGFLPFRIIGALMIATGLIVLLDSFARFAIQGLGTPAPVAPPQHLVVTGLYRYVRNPMYVAVLSLIFGQGSSAASDFWSTDSLSGWDFLPLFFFMKSLRCAEHSGKNTRNSAHTCPAGFPA